MKEIVLIRGQIAIVDDEDYERLNQYKWHIAGKGYAVREGGTQNNKRQPKIYMHREAIGVPPISMEVDHINHNRLDNRKINLRYCTHKQNCANSIMKSNNTSGRKGVNWHKASKKWRAEIRYLGKKKYLGVYNELDKASEIYDEAAKIIFGEFAVLNNIAELAHGTGERYLEKA